MTDPPEVNVYARPEALVAAAAGRFVAAAHAAIARSGRFVVALSGGTTPERMYASLASEPWRSQVAWEAVHWFWGDERAVPPEDPASNYGLARRVLLDRVPVVSSQVHRIRGEDDPRQAAAACERELRQLLQTPSGPPSHRPGARLDLVLLGLGLDGHTASLFPGRAALHEHRRWVVADQVPAVPSARVTLTVPLINAAAEVIFLVAGPSKAAILHRVLEGSPEPGVLPAQSIRPDQGRLTWLVDAAAATRSSFRMSPNPHQ